MSLLVVESGPERGRQYPISESPLLIGRHPECHIVLELSSVSRYHAEIFQEGKQVFVKDRKSRNKTFLNNEPIEGTVPLRSGDQIRICEVAFRFRGEDQIATQPLSQERSSGGVFSLEADESETGSTIMKLDISPGGVAPVAASPEAKLAALLEINRSIAKALALDDVLPKVLDGLFRIFIQADRGFIVLKGPNDELIPRWMKTRRDTGDETIRVSKTIINEVLNAKEAILSADAAVDDRFEMSQSIADFRIRSMMCAPLINSEGEPLGVLQIDTLDQRKKFVGEDLEILISVAGQAGIAINNAQLHEQALRQRAIERDLELAHEVQRGFLPTQSPEIPGYVFYDYYQPANHVGGDYYDYVTLPDGRLAIIVADVVGHGVAAALLMAKLSAEARYCLAMKPDPATALTELNQRFCGPRSDQFATLIMVVLDLENHTATIVNAGHMAPIRRRRNGTVDEVAEEIGNVPVGIMEGVEYEQAVIQLEPGDTLTLYTDGINEAMDSRDACYTIERMHEQIRAFEGGMSGYGENLIDDVRRFMDRIPQNDDMCLVCFSRELE
jgi:phosphoserine phosphatase RsbU/P